MAAGGHLGFPIETILAIFDLQITPMLLTQIGILVQKKKRKINFQNGYGGHLGFPIETILSISDLQVKPMIQLASRFRRREKYIFKIATTAAILDFQSDRF